MFTAIGKIWTLLGVKQKATLAGTVLGVLIVAVLLTWLVTKWTVTARVEAAKDAEWELKIATAPVETTIIERVVKLPGKQVVLPGKPVVMTVEDSAKVLALIAQNDSLGGLVFELMKTRTTTDEDTVGTVQVWYYPFLGSFEIHRQYKPWKTYDRIVEKKVLAERDLPHLRLNGGVGWLPAGVYGYAEGEVRLIDKFWIGPRVETGMKGEKPRWGLQGKYSVEW